MWYKKVNDIFDKLINSEYYKSCYDYEKILMSEEKYEEAKKIFKLGMEKWSTILFRGIYIFFIDINWFE